MASAEQNEPAEDERYNEKHCMQEAERKRQRLSRARRILSQKRTQPEEQLRDTNPEGYDATQQGVSYVNATNGNLEEQLDPLDEFMSTQVQPEVEAAQQQEQSHALEQRLQRAREMEDEKKRGLDPKQHLHQQAAAAADETDDPFEHADEEVQIPAKYVGVLIGPEGQTIRDIQKRSKCRVQLKKEDEELYVGYGVSNTIAVAAKQAKKRAAAKGVLGKRKSVEDALKDQQPQLAAGSAQTNAAAERAEDSGDDSASKSDDDAHANQGAEQNEEEAQQKSNDTKEGSALARTVQLFGDTNSRKRAKHMIQEVFDKEEQRRKERREDDKERRKAHKRRMRKLFQLRHQGDYYMLGVEVGADWEEVKKAYRKLAARLHPDKHPDDPEGARQKFMQVQQAYQRLQEADVDTEMKALDASKKSK